MTGTRTANLVYDPLGRLLQVDEGTSGTTSLFLYDGDNLAAEYAGDGATMTKRYVFGRGVDEPIAEATGSLLDCSSAKFLHADNQGSIIARADCSGNIVNRNTYDEWGIPGTGNAGRFQYTGQMWMPEIGMYYYKARIYSPTLGRFLQTDPIGYKDQINLYAYVGNDPLNFEDPTGNFATGCGSNTNRNAEGCTSQQVYDPNDDPSKVNKSEDSKRETKEEQQNKAMSNNLSNSVVVALQKACHCKIDHRNIQPLTPNAARVVDPSKLPPIFTRSFSIHSRSAGYADIGHGYVIKLYPHDSDNRGLPTITITTSITNPYHWINVPFYEMGDPINNYNARQWCLASSAC